MGRLAIVANSPRLGALCCEAKMLIVAEAIVSKEVVDFVGSEVPQRVRSVRRVARTDGWWLR